MLDRNGEIAQRDDRGERCQIPHLYKDSEASSTFSFPALITDDEPDRKHSHQHERFSMPASAGWRFCSGSTWRCWLL
jgi:hypothetical protein